MSIRKALTVGEIAKRLSCPVHRIEYLVRFRKLTPIEKAGNLRVFSDEALQLLRDEVEQQKDVPNDTKNID